MLDREIDKPLGLKQPAPDKAGGLLTPKRMLAALAVVAVLGGSAAIALRERPFHEPIIEIAVEQPKPVAAPEPAVPAAPAKPAVTAAAPPRTEDGPSIIKVGPSNETTAGVVVIRDPGDLSQNALTAHMPDSALIEKTAAGNLPIASADGRRPFDVYARKWSGARGARVAIVIGGLGMSQTGTQQAIKKLQPEVTLGFAPQGNSVNRWMTNARRDGHEIVMQVPLEPFDYPNVNPGRNTLTVSASPAQNVEDLRSTLAKTTNYTGVMNYMGARFTGDSAAMEPVMAELGKRGLLYLDDGTSARSVAAELALKNGVPYAAGDAVIDQVRERGAILAKLDELERIARAKGTAVGTGSAFDETVDAVRSWVSEARKRGIEIVPISALALDPRRG